MHKSSRRQKRVVVGKSSSRFLGLVAFCLLASQTFAISSLIPLNEKKQTAENMILSFAEYLTPLEDKEDLGRAVFFEMAVDRRITYMIDAANEGKLNVDGKAFNTALTLRSPDGRMVVYKKHIEKAMEHSVRQLYEHGQADAKSIDQAAGTKYQIAFAKGLTCASIELARIFFALRRDLKFKEAIMLANGVGKFLVEYFPNNPTIQKKLLQTLATSPIIFPSRKEIFQLRDKGGKAVLGNKLASSKEAGRVESLTLIVTIPDDLMTDLANWFSKITAGKSQNEEFPIVMAQDGMKIFLDNDFNKIEESLRSCGAYPKAEILSMRSSSFLLTWNLMLNPDFKKNHPYEDAALSRRLAKFSTENGEKDPQKLAILTADQTEIAPPDFSKLTYYRNKALAAQKPEQFSLDLANIKARFGQDFPMEKNIRTILEGKGTGFFNAVTSIFGFFPTQYTWPTVSADQAKLLGKMFDMPSLLQTFDDRLIRSNIFSTFVEFYPGLAQDFIYSLPGFRAMRRLSASQLQQFSADGRCLFERMLGQARPQILESSGIGIFEHMVNDFLIKTSNHYSSYPKVYEFTDFYASSLFAEWLKRDPTAIDSIAAVLKCRANALLTHRRRAKVAELVPTSLSNQQLVDVLEKLDSALMVQEKLIFDESIRGHNHEAIKKILAEKVLPLLAVLKPLLDGKDPSEFYRIANLCLFGHDSRDFLIYSKKSQTISAQNLVDWAIDEKNSLYKPFYKYKKEHAQPLDLIAHLSAKDKTVLGQVLEWETRQDRIYASEGFTKQHGPVMFRGVATFTNDLDQAERFIRSTADRGEFIPSTGLFQSTNPGSDLHDNTHPLCDLAHGATNTLAVKSSTRNPDIAHLYASRLYFSPKGSQTFFFIKVIARDISRPLVNVSNVYMLEEGIFDNEDASANIFPEEHIITLIYYPPTPEDIAAQRFKIARVLTHEGFFQGRLNSKWPVNDDAKIRNGLEKLTYEGRIASLTSAEQDLIIRKALEKLANPDCEVWVEYASLQQIVNTGMATIQEHISGAFPHSLSYGRWILERDYAKRRRLDIKERLSHDIANPKLDLEDEWRLVFGVDGPSSNL